MLVRIVDSSVFFILFPLHVIKPQILFLVGPESFWDGERGSRIQMFDFWGGFVLGFGTGEGCCPSAAVGSCRGLFPL